MLHGLNKIEVHMNRRLLTVTGWLMVFVLGLLLLRDPVVAQNGSGEKPPWLERHKYDTLMLKPTGDAGDFDSGMVDCFKIVMDYSRESDHPIPYTRDGYYYAVYTGYDRTRMMRTEGRYRLGLARSPDLLHWERLGNILGLGKPGAFDAGSVGVGIAMRWGGIFYLFYTGFAGEGYEHGPGKIGLATSDNLQDWERKGIVLEPNSTHQWESAGLYQVYPMRHGGTFYLFYNAKDRQSNWREQIGVATSQDLYHWERYNENPVVRTGAPGTWDAKFVADPWVIPIRGTWYMFYYGFDGTYAREGMAVSEDLFHWEKSSWNPILSEGPEGTFDAKYAHKPCVIEHDGIYYHYYTAVGSRGRCIALATSQPLTNIQRRTQHE